MLLIETVQSFEGVENFVLGHSGSPKALKQIYLLYGKSGLICIVRHGFQQKHWKGTEHTLHEVNQYPFQRLSALLIILRILAEFSPPGTAPSPTSQYEGLR